MERLRQVVGKVGPAAGAVLALLLVLGASTRAQAATDPGCTLLNGNDATGECVLTGTVTIAGTVVVNETVHMLGGSSILVDAAPPGGLTLSITSGDFVMESGSLVSGDVQCGATSDTGRKIKVDVTAGNVNVKTGAIIRSNSCQGGFIEITTAAPGTIDIDGLVQSVGFNTGGSAGNQPAGGGPITIKAGCDLTISDTGVVSSVGLDPGADLVHLEGCVVTVFGLVQSTASGHKIPNNPPNSCSDVAPLFGSTRRNPVTRPGKPINSTGCVEIWSGTTVLIDSTGTHKGEVNADIGFAGGAEGRGWIDILANGNIEIKDGAGNNHVVNICGNPLSVIFAVHANGGMCQGNDDGGLILIQSYGGSVTASGQAIQADGYNALNQNSGGKGGEIRVEAFTNVTFTAADIFARGDFDSPTFGNGGKIGPTISSEPLPLVSPAPIRAFNGALSWTGSGDARPVGGTVPVAQWGEINLQACLSVSTVGATFPTNGAPPPPPPYPNVFALACGGAPTKPAYAVAGFPLGTCITLCGPVPGNKSGVKFNDVNQNGVKDAGEPGLPNWEIKAFNNLGVLVDTQITNAAGEYAFNLAPGTYTVCETLQAGWTQTAPCLAGGPPATCTGTPIPLGESIANCTLLGAGLGPRGYTFTVGATPLVNNDFGNFQPPVVCTKFPNLVPTTTVTLDPSKANQIQTAINNANTDDVILVMPLNGTTKENIVINKRIQLIGCSVVLTATDPGSPVVRIVAGATGGLTKDVHATGSTVAGYQIDGSGNNIENVRSFGNAIGFLVTGNSNVLKGTLGTTKNGTGFKVTGSSNTLDTNNDISNNSGDGVVISSGSLNVVKKLTVKGNGGNGILVEAAAANTTLSENKAFSNGLNGFLILGANTTMSKNVAGDIGTGNTGDGIRVVGNGGAISESTAKANGLVGIRVTGTNHTLSKNKSGGTPSQNNSSCQYVVGAGNSNGNQNTSSNGATFTFTAAGANSPAGCVPATPIP